MSAFTPNICWAELGCAGIVDMEGAGTSSATPQIASAVALYLQKHGPVLFDRSRYPETWMRVEAVRHALFTAADKNADGGSSEKLGNGILQAAAALAVSPPVAAALHQTPRDSAVFPVLRVLTGIGAAESPSIDAMLALEATQLAHRWSDEDRPNAVELAITDPDRPADAVPQDEVRRFLDAIIEHPDASRALKDRAAEARRLFPGGRPAPRRRPPSRPRKEQIAAALPPAVPNPRI